MPQLMALGLSLGFTLFYEFVTSVFAAFHAALVGQHKGITLRVWTSLKTQTTQRMVGSLLPGAGAADAAFGLRGHWLSHFAPYMFP